MSSEPQKTTFHVVICQTTLKDSTKKRAARATRLFFLLRCCCCRLLSKLKTWVYLLFRLPGLACTCIYLRSLWSRSNLRASQCKFFTVCPPSASLFTSSTCRYLRLLATTCDYLRVRLTNALESGKQIK